MGNCLDAPEPKNKRHHRPRRQNVPANPILMAVPPDGFPVGPEGVYPYLPHHHHHHSDFYPYSPEQQLAEGHMIPPGPPPGHVLMVDPSTGQQFFVPLVDQPYPEHQYVYYADYAQPYAYYNNNNNQVPNGVEPKANKPSRRHHREKHEEDEVDKGEARALRKKSREERKTSQGHDSDKVDIRDAASFKTTAIVTATTPPKAAETAPRTAAETASTTATAAAPIVASSITAATVLTTSSNHVEHVTADPPTTVETSRFKRYMPTPPPTPPLPPPPPEPVPHPTDASISRMDENEDKEIVVDALNIDDTDHSMARRISVSFNRDPDVIIPQSKFEMPEEQNDEEEEEELPQVVTSQGVVPPIVFSKPSRCFDVVITYSILTMLESDIVRRLTSQLEASGISVWAERLGDSSRARKSDATAKAILGSKVVVVILSEGSCHQRFIRDHVALATVINAAIFPVTTQPPLELIDAMPVELKLQLPNEPEEWTEIGNNNEYSFLFNLRSLARSVQEDVERLRDKQKENDGKPMANKLARRLSSAHILRATTFWDVHFGHRHSVKWERMEKTLQEEFDEQLKSLGERPSQSAVLDGLKKKTCDERDPDTVTKDKFTAVCRPDGEDIGVWEAILKVARREQAVRDVFDTESTVRHLVLEQAELLGRHSVVEMLCQLLSDADANVRAVSVVSLSKCILPGDTRALHLVMETLSDEDRLVREAGCLALGGLKLHSAVTKLIHVWRNDVISHVREAAYLALSQMESEKGEEAMRLTAVLSDEIRALTSDTLE